MTVIAATNAADMTFRINDTPGTRLQKLELLRLAAVGVSGTSKTLYISITEGLSAADPASPLLRFRMRTDWLLDVAAGEAGVAATAATVFRVKKNGAANGSLTFTGTTMADSIIDRNYPSGSLLEIYPPLVADATLDDVSISLPLTVS